MKLLEAVPNISQGQDKRVLRQLRQVVLSHPRVQLLHTDANPAANRTVFTLLGQPQALCKALFDFVQQATQLIDMRTHHGVHPRLGAVDVCPLVPVQEISLAQAAQLAQQLGKRIGQELDIPVYLYEAAARRENCRNLADIRWGEYENLAQKLAALPPDFGPTQFTPHVAQTGACVVGARPFLIAFNINLNTKDVSPARHIAARLRQSGGGLRGVKAIGWYVENFQRAQVSCNITDFHAAPLHLVYQTAQQYAAQLGLQATGCELVGLVPLQAMLIAGKHYAPHETNTRLLLEAAAQGLHLSDVKPFDISQQVLEIKAGLTPLEK